MVKLWQETGQGIYCKFNAKSNIQRILGIGQHLKNLQTYNIVGLSMTHNVVVIQTNELFIRCKLDLCKETRCIFFARQCRLRTAPL